MKTARLSVLRVVTDMGDTPMQDFIATVTHEKPGASYFEVMTYVVDFLEKQGVEILHLETGEGEPIGTQAVAEFRKHCTRLHHRRN